MSIAAPLPGVIRDKLSAMDRQQRELTLVRGLGECLLFLCVAMGACLFADRAWNLDPIWRTVLLASLAAFAGGLVWFRLIRPAVRRRNWAELAAAVERQHPELTERLTTLVELQSESNRTGSPLMHELLAKQTVRAVSKVDFSQALPSGRTVQRAALGLAALAVLLLPFLIPNGRYAQSWSRLFHPWGNHAWGSRLAFHVIDGDRVVAKGTDITLQAELQGEQPSEKSPLEATLRWVDAAGHSHQRPMAWNAEDQTYSWTISRVEQSFRFHVSSRRAVSQEYRVTAADRPQVTAVNIDVQPPGYTGLPAQSLDAIVGKLSVPEQSQVRFRWQFAEPVAAAAILWPEQPPGEPVAKSEEEDSEPPIRQAEIALNLSDDRRSATAQLPATASGPFQLQLSSDLGLDSDEPSHELVLIPDLPPEISVERNEQFAAVRPDDVLPIPMSASDDYGLSAVELHWQTSTGQEGRRAIPQEELSGRQHDETLELDLADLHLQEGQTVSLKLRAVDNRPVPDPQETWTDAWEISISSQADSLESRQLAAAHDMLEQKIDALEDAVAMQKQAVDTEHRETARNAVKGDEPPENQAELDQLRQRQQEIRDQLEELQRELEQRPFLEKAAAEHVPQVERELAEAQQSLEQAAKAEGAREQIEQLSQSLDELAQAEDQLAKLKQEAKSLAALEQELSELGRLSRDAEKLADRAEQLEQRAAKPQASAQPDRQEKTSAPSDPARGDSAEPESSAPTAEELDALRQETEELAEHLDDLLRRRPELLEAARQHELERLARLADMAQCLAEPQGQLAQAMAQEAERENSDSPDPTGDDAAERDSGAASDPSATKPAPSPENASPKNANAGESVSQESAPSKNETANNPADPEAANNDAAAPNDASKSSPAKPEPSDTSNANTENRDGPQGSQPKSPPANRELAADIARTVQQQQQLAREAAQLQRDAEDAAGNDGTPANPSDQSPANANPEGDSPAAPMPNASPQRESLSDFAKQAQAASQAAQAGDLKRASEQSEQASQSAGSASQPAANQPKSPAEKQAGQLADRQQALAEEFQRLAQSPEARQTAQQQSQQQLNKTAESLAKALEKSAERLSQQPLDLKKPGDAAASACKSCQSAGNSMKGASQSLAQGNSPKASQQAQAAREQLQEAAQQAGESAGEKPGSSPQAAKVPGNAASQVAQAASQLKQAQDNLSQAQPGESSGQSQPGESKSSGEETPASDKPGESTQPGRGESTSEKSAAPNESPSDEGSSAKDSAQASNSQPQPSPLEKSAGQLRQAAQALAGACKACQSGSPGKPGSSGKPGKSQGPSNANVAENGPQPNSDPAADPGEPEGFANVGNGFTGEASDADALLASPKAAGSRNWGRLPKHLQSEIRQGSTKKPHPEYTRQIKQYFEKIAQPAEKRDRP